MEDMRCPNCRLDDYDEDHLNDDGVMVYECRNCEEQFTEEEAEFIEYED